MYRLELLHKEKGLDFVYIVTDKYDVIALPLEQQYNFLFRITSRFILSVSYIMRAFRVYLECLYSTRPSFIAIFTSPTIFLAPSFCNRL